MRLFPCLIRTVTYQEHAGIVDTHYPPPRTANRYAVYNTRMMWLFPTHAGNTMWVPYRTLDGDIANYKHDSFL